MKSRADEMIVQDQTQGERRVNLGFHNLALYSG